MSTRKPQFELTRVIDGQPPEPPEIVPLAALPWDSRTDRLGFLATGMTVAAALALAGCGRDSTETPRTVDGTSADAAAAAQRKRDWDAAAKRGRELEERRTRALRVRRRKRRREAARRRGRREAERRRAAELARQAAPPPPPPPPVAGYGGGGSYCTCNKVCTCIPVSDRALKTAIVSLAATGSHSTLATGGESVPAPTDVLARLAEVHGVSWRWRDEEAVVALGLQPGARAAGVVAQDVEAVFAEVVARGDDGYLRVDYHGLVGVLIEAVKELALRLDHVERAARSLSSASGRTY